MNHSQFIDMSNTLSAASHGSLGDEKEHKHWNSRQIFYKTMLKYIFQGVGLTPHVQALVQHVTPWDHEFAAAIMEQNAARAIDMPTIMYVASK